MRGGEPRRALCVTVRARGLARLFQTGFAALCAGRSRDGLCAAASASSTICVPARLDADLLLMTHRCMFVHLDDTSAAKQHFLKLKIGRGCTLYACTAAQTVLSGDAVSVCLGQCVYGAIRRQKHPGMVPAVQICSLVMCRVFLFYSEGQSR